MTASTGSNALARSNHATIAPPVCASAATRSATVVLPEDAPPRNATVAERGSPPVPRIASSAANPVETIRPSRFVAGVAGVATASSAGSSSGIGARASAPSTIPASSLPRRGAAAPQ